MIHLERQTKLIIGGGIFGVTAALELRRRDWKVTLLDPGPIPFPRASSTDISKVVRMDYGADDFYVDLMVEALRRWDGWNERWGEGLYHEDGFLIMSGEPLRAGSFEFESYERVRARGVDVRRIGSSQLAAQFPAWNAARYVDGYFNPRAGWAESGAVVGRLLADAQSAGVEVRERQLFSSLIESDSRVVGVETLRGDRFYADHVVMASGAWTPALLPHLAPFMRVIGQPVVYLQVPDPAPYQPPHFSCWAADIARTGWYGFPSTSDGIFKIGNHGPGIPVHPDEIITVPQSHIDRCREFLRETFPGLADAPIVKTRMCLYCDTWDGNFYIDHDPDRPGLFIAAGGSGHGFKFAPVLGEIIADALERKPNPWKSRFAWRAVGGLKAEDARYTASK